MKLTKQRLKEIIKEELAAIIEQDESLQSPSDRPGDVSSHVAALLSELDVGGSLSHLMRARSGPGWREETPRDREELDKLYRTRADEKEDIISELKEILQVWEYREYASDRERWREYAEDIQALVKRHEVPLEENKQDEPE